MCGFLTDGNVGCCLRPFFLRRKGLLCERDRMLADGKNTVELTKLRVNAGEIFPRQDFDKRLMERADTRAVELLAE